MSKFWELFIYIYKVAFTVLAFLAFALGVPGLIIVGLGLLWSTGVIGAIAAVVLGLFFLPAYMVCGVMLVEKYGDRTL